MPDGATRPKGWPLVGNLPGFALEMARQRGDFLRAVQRLLARHSTRTLELKLAHRRLLITTDPRVAHEIVGERAGEYPKTDWEHRVLEPAMEGGLIILEGPSWKEHRHALASCFGPVGMARLTELARAAFEARASRWRGRRPVDLGRELRCMVTDVMFRYFVDSPPIGVERTALAFERVETGLERRVFSLAGLLPGWARRLFEREGGFASSLAYVSESIEAGVREGAPLAKDGTPLALLSSRLGGEAAWKEIRTSFGAGATTGHLLSWLGHLLAEHPEAQRRLRAELPAEDPGLPELEALPYLSAVIHEGLRLYPPAPFLIRQTRGRRSALLFVAVWAMHRDPELWEEPDRFRPERWLDGEGRFVSRLPDAFVPFGIGPRVCVGKRFALVEARVILSALVRRFDLKPAGEAPRPVFKILTRPNGGPRLLLEERVKVLADSTTGPSAIQSCA